MQSLPKWSAPSTVPSRRPALAGLASARSTAFAGVFACAAAGAPLTLAASLSITLALTACAADPPPVVVKRPQPTENWIQLEDEKQSSAGRKQWIAELHRAAPDTDWKQIERRNGEEQLAKRNQLASMAAVTSLWTEVGSRNQSGRMHATTFAPDGQSLYSGSSLGGVWHATLDGQEWTPLGDNLYGGGHFLAVIPGAVPGGPDVVLRATEDGLIHVTRDFGATWQQPTGVANVSAVRRVLTRADGSGTIFLVARYPEILGAQKWALYRSTDGALSFQRVYTIGTAAGDAWISRTGASPVYVLTSNKLRISTDEGSTFSDIASLPVTTTAGEVAGSEAGAPRFWAALDVSGTRTLYRSDDAGLNWTLVTTLSDYWIGSMSASIVNADLFAFGGVDCMRTSNAGGSFVKVNNWFDYYGDVANKLHADINGIDVLPTGAGTETWYVNTDGGPFRSTDSLVTVENLSLDGLRVSQYYTTHTSTANPLHVVAGSQDQGYQWADAPPPDPENGLLDFDQLISGDYGHATSGDGTQAYVFSVYPGFILVHKGENNPQLFQEDFPPGESYSWLPFIAGDPLNNERFYFCATQLYRYKKTTTFGNSWTPVLWSTQNFSISGGEYLSALDFSPGDSERAYACTNYGRFWRSLDRGVTWTQGTGSGPGPQYLYGQAIVASSLDVDTAYVGGSGYSNPAVWRTTDGGLTWQPFNDGIPSTLVYCLGEAPDGSGVLVAGTERGCYRRDPASATWVDITANEAPVTVYWTVEAVPSTNVMRFGTYGRGIWDYSLNEPCSYAAYGVGVGGTNTVLLDSSSGTQIGSTHVLEVSAAPASSPGTLLYSPGAASLPFKGGTLLVSLSLFLQIPIATTPAGTASLPLAIPSDAALVDLPLNFQVVFKLGPSGPWALSNGLSGTLCP